MAKKRTVKSSELVGLFIYHDKKYETVYYDIFTKKGYQIINQDALKYQLYSNSFTLATVIAFAIYYSLKLNMVYFFLMTIGLSILGGIIGRFSFIYQLPEAKGFVPAKRENIFQSYAERYSKTRLILILVMLFALGACLIILVGMEDYSIGYNIVLYLMAIACFILAICCFITILVQAKLKNK